MLKRSLLIAALATLFFPTITVAEDKKPSILLIGVGGNSESIFRHGIWGLIQKDGDKQQGELTASLRTATGLSKFAVREHYYSWTGDPETHKGILPGNTGWVTEGSRLIREDLKTLDRVGPETKVVIVGWSNGGATAYELACDLTRKRAGSVSLLVTLDAASRSTTECTNRAGKAMRPAKKWIGVYTKSEGLSRLSMSNVIAVVGRAWDDTFPTAAGQRANPLYKLEPASHGDAEKMWGLCVTRSASFRAWAASEFGRSYPAARVDADCKLM